MLFSGWTGNLDAHSGQAKKYSIRKTSHLITYQARRKIKIFGGDNSTGKYSSESLFCLSENLNMFLHVCAKALTN